MPKQSTRAASALQPKRATETKKRQRRSLPPVPTIAGDDPLLTAREATAYRRTALSTFWRDVQEGAVRAPIRLTPKAPRWRLSWLAPTDTVDATRAATPAPSGGGGRRRTERTEAPVDARM